MTGGRRPACARVVSMVRLAANDVPARARRGAPDGTCAAPLRAMNVLILNVGSTSVRYAAYDMDTEVVIARGHEPGVGADQLDAVLHAILERLPFVPDAVGHRVVHGGERLIQPVVVDALVEQIIEEHAAFAPLHNPINLRGIRAARAALPGVPQVAVFDTAFHAHLPPAAFLYGIAYDDYLSYGIRRYGFHGASHRHMAETAAKHLGADVARLRLVTCHLGGGASVAAIDGGVSVDTSMGLTPLEGLPMQTRCGDLDPGIPLLLARRGLAPDDVDDLLNRRAGLAAVAGIDGGFLAIERAAADGHPRARLAVDLFVHRLRKYVGAYAAVLGGLDALVFSGGIGEGSAAVRAQACATLGFLGVAIDADRNRDARPQDAGVVDVAADGARTRVLVVHADEERVIARDVVRALRGETAAAARVPTATLPVGVSVRHVHLAEADREALFGPGALTPRRDLSQPGQFLARETVDLIGPAGELHGVAIVGPTRARTQVELARSDAIALGVDAPVRLSGALDGTPGLTLRGPAGTRALADGAIVAMRHVHMSPADASRFGVAHGDLIRVEVGGDRELVFGDVAVRVDPRHALDLHLDTDEANAAGLDNDSVVTFAGVQHRA